MKAQGATEYLVLLGVALLLATLVVGMLVWPTGSTKDVKRQQTDIKFKIGAIEYPELLDGLAAYWKFEEGGGTSAADSRGANAGNLTNGPTWVSGKSGYALDFDGVDDYVVLPSVNPTGAITVAAWVKSANSSDYSGRWQLVSKYSAYILGKNDGGQICFIIHNGIDWQGETSNCYVPTPSEWHHFAGTYDSSSGLLQLYVDGGLKNYTSTSGTINADTGPIHLAHRESSPGTTYFAGTIDEVLIFSRVLSANEIRLLYENPGYPQ